MALPFCPCWIANFHKSLQILALSYLPFSNVVVGWVGWRGVAVGGCYCLLVVEWRYQVLAVECWVLAVDCRCRLSLTFSIVGVQLCRKLKVRTANNFGLMYSRKRICQNSFPNFIYIFQKSFMIF
jgi:hypothetical protein